MVCHGSSDKRGAGYGHGLGVGKMLGTTSINERGQAVIPDKARKELGIKGDDMFVVFGNKRSGALILIKSEVFEEFAESFMTKLGKLEKYAQDFFYPQDGPDGVHDASDPDTGPSKGDGGPGDKTSAPEPGPSNEGSDPGSEA
jgi:bifunctional DNA-binding transcriptional regulator/antitoxin component of YhaV-PrlF toxin-antitoxin module